MPKSDLTYRTNTDEADTKTNDTSDVIENITQKVKSAPREEGQDVRDYIQKQGTHTGLIGAVVGTIMAAASFVSELAGTIVRNLLWSQQMQDAIANRLNRESPRKTSTVVDKEKTSKEETTIEKETPQVNIKNLMKQYDINGRKFGDSVFLQNGEDNSTISPDDCKDVGELEKAIAAVYGHNMQTSIKASLISAAVTLPGEQEGKSLVHEIQTKRGIVDMEIRKIDKNNISISINGNDVIKKIPEAILKSPNAFQAVDGKKSIVDYIGSKINEELSRSHQISKDLTLTISKNNTISIKDQQGEIYKGSADMQAFEQIFAKHPLEGISPKVAAAALTCTLSPESFAKEYEQKSIFDDKTYQETSVHIGVSQDKVTLYKPSLVEMDRDVGDLVKESSQNRSIKKIIKDLSVSKDDAKVIKSLQENETVVVSSNGVPSFVMSGGEGELYLYQPEKMPEIIKKCEIEPYLAEHTDRLTVLVEKEDKRVQTAYMEENGKVAYAPAFVEMGYQMDPSVMIESLTPDSITPDNFRSFAHDLSELYQSADMNNAEKTVDIPFNQEKESFHYVNEYDEKNVERNKNVDEESQDIDEQEEELPFPEDNSHEDEKGEKEDDADREEEQEEDYVLPFDDGEIEL